MNACFMCDNCIINEDLDFDNDYACFGVGEADKNYRFMVCTGWGKPLRVEFEKWNDVRKVWETIGIYNPMFCPNCGRELKEFQSERTGKIKPCSRLHRKNV